MATTRRSILVRILGALALAASLGAGAQPTVFTVTNTNASGPGSLAGVLADQFAACPASSRIEFAIPAATDPNCNATSGVCKVQVTENLDVRCSDTVVDGYSQPGAAPNTATDMTNNAQLKIELASANTNQFKAVRVAGASLPFGNIAIFNVTLRGLALPQHQIILIPANNSSIPGNGGGHVVSGNWFGFHADGTIQIATPSHGVQFSGDLMTDVTIGGPDPADRNLITYLFSGCCTQQPAGIHTFGSSGTLIEGNYFNVAPDGSELTNNHMAGAIVFSSQGSAARNTIIRNNVVRSINDGAQPLRLGTGPGITVSRNSITGLSSHLAAWTFTPAGQGGSNSQASPVLDGVTVSATQVLVSGSVQSGANRTIRLEFFHNSQPYQAGGARTERFAGFIDVNVGPGGSTSFIASLPADTRNVAASATDLTSGETSLLNQNVPPQSLLPVFTVTNTNASGPGSLTGVLADQFAACPDSSRIEFAIPAATDPNCDAGTGICRIQAPDEVTVRCSNTVVDGYTQPGASPNTATDYTNTAQIRIELDGAGPATVKYLNLLGADHVSGHHPLFNITFRGLALPRHTMEMRGGHSGSVETGGGGHVVAGNWFGWHANGTRATGIVSRGLHFHSHWIENVTVGGAAPADRNLFTYKDGAGEITAIRGDGALHALIEGNFINVAPDGTPVPPNGVGGAILMFSNGNTPYSQDSVIRNNVIYNVQGGFPVSLGLGPGITMSRNAISGHAAHLPAWTFTTAAQGGGNSQVSPVITGVTESPTEVLVFGTVQSGADRTVRLEFFHNTLPYQANAAHTERFVGFIDVNVGPGGSTSFTASLPADTRNVAVSATNLTSGETSLLNQGAPPSQVFPLNVSRSGPGLGTVTSGEATPLVNCTGSCTVVFSPGTVVTLTAAAQPGSGFSGWSGDCTGTGACMVTMNDIRNVTANYVGGSGPPVITNAPLSADVTVAVPFTFTYSTTGAVPITWSLEPDCTLPFGFSLNVSTGTISGTAGSDSERIECAVRASNGINPDAVQDYELRANIKPGTPLFTGATTLTAGTTGVTYGHTMAVQGTAPLAITAVAGTIPPGLTLSSAGVFSGAPTLAGTFDFRLRAQGPDGSATKAFRIVVGQGVAPVITSGAPPNGAEFTAYSHTFTANGTTPLTWSVISGALPPGLTLDAGSGTLAGTPAEPGPFTFTVQAANGTLPNATQPVSLSVATNSRTLSIVKNGNGSGTVSSSPAGIDCGSTCSKSFPISASMQLTATPDADSLFTGWSNGCTGTGACSFVLSSSRTIHAQFTKRQFALATTVTGPGTVTSAPTGVSCTTSCSTNFDIATVVTLTATPTGSAIFEGWSGACTGTGSCVVTMDAARSVTATFVPMRSLTVQIQGGGGTVTSTPAGIDCPSACSASFLQGTQVQLTATPSPGSIFNGWTGSACSGTGVCDFSMTATRVVGASFSSATQALTIDVAPDGLGSVHAAGTGLSEDCTTLCNYAPATGTTVTLTAAPTPYSVFTGWSGACSGTTTTCTLSMSAARSATASFAVKTVTVTVAKAGDGTGTVAGSGINCGATCSVQVQASPSGFTVTATPAAGSVFTGWTGPCASPTAPQCVADLQQNATITATFQTLKRITVTTNGHASVASSPAGLACTTASYAAPTVCTGLFQPGAAVTLTGHPSSAVSSWLGGCARSGPSCSVTMSQDHVLQVSFGGAHLPAIIGKGHGAGTVTVANGGGEFVRCEAAQGDCDQQFLAADTLTFSATPAAGHGHLGWVVNGVQGRFFVSNQCHQASAQCVLSLSDPAVLDVAHNRGGVPTVDALFVKFPATIAGVATATMPALARNTRVGTPFLPAPAVQLRDSSGNPVQGARVTFTPIPGGSGASGSSTPNGAQPSFTSSSGADGIASVSLFANGIVGSWTLRVTVQPGNVAPLDIAMSNTNETVPVTIPGNGRATIPTSSAVGVRLSVVVRLTTGQPVNGATVRFTAPASPNSLGNNVPSGTFSQPTVVTGSNGIARTVLSSNGVSGTFAVTVRVTLPAGPFGGGAAAGFEGDDYVTELTVQTDDTLSNVVANDPNGDYDNDGIPNAVEDAEGTLPFDKDNDVFTDARLFSMQQYRDFLAREGDAGGIEFWSNQVATGGLTRAQTIESFFSSYEFQGTIAPVARLYFAYFLRVPDYAGLNFWIGYFKGGNSLEAISNAFAASGEFQALYGALNNEQFVTLVYQNVLDRAPDAPGLAFWRGQLDSGSMTRGQVMLGFSESAEYKDTSDSLVYVTMMYLGMLHRAPDAGGFDFWVQYRDAGNSGLALIDGFLGSQEYRGRFLP